MIAVLLGSQLAFADPPGTLRCVNETKTHEIALPAPTRYSYVQSPGECWLSDQVSSPSRPLRAYFAFDAPDAPPLTAERAVLWAVNAELFRGDVHVEPAPTLRPGIPPTPTFLLRGVPADGTGLREAYVARRADGRVSATLAVHYDAHHRHRYPERAGALIDETTLQPMTPDPVPTSMLRAPPQQQGQ